MMSTPKENNLWEGIQGYQDGDQVIEYDSERPNPDLYSSIQVNRGGMSDEKAAALLNEARARSRREMFQGTVFDPLAQPQGTTLNLLSDDPLAQSTEPEPFNILAPGMQLSDVLSHFGNLKDKPNLLSRWESQAQAGDERRAAEAAERSRMNYAQQYMSDDAPLDIKRGLMGQFMPEAVSAPDVPEEMSLADIGKKAHGWLGKATADIDAPEDWQYALDQNIKGESLDPAMMKAMPAAPDMTNIMDVAAVTPEMKKRGLDDMIAGALLKGGRGIGSLGSAGAKLAGKGISKGLELAGAGIGAGAQGIGGLLGALAGIPGDIAKAYQSYGEDERYPALAQLASASQGKIMPNIYASLYRQDGGIIPYAVGGQVQQDPNKAWTFGTTNPVTPSQPSYDITLPSTGEGDEGGGSGIPPVPPVVPPNPPNPPNPPGGDPYGDDPHLGAGDVGMGTGVYNPTSPAGDPNDPVSYGYGGDQYGAGQLGTTGQYMGDYGGYASMFGGDTGSAASLSQAEVNLGIQLTPEQRKLYGEYNPRIEEMGINIGGRRGLLGLTKDRQTQMSQSGFAGMDSTAYGVGREDLLRDIDLQKRGKRAGYQKDIAGQVAEDIRAGLNIADRQDPSDVDIDAVYGEWDVPPLEDPAWNPPAGVGSGTSYDFGGVTYIFDPPNWVTEDQYESDIDDFYGSDDF